MQHDIFDASTHLFGANALFIEELYDRYLKDRASVDASWQSFFDGMGDVQGRMSASWGTNDEQIIGAREETAAVKPAAAKDGTKAAAVDTGLLVRSIQALRMVNAYRVRGHLIADLDPLRHAASKYHPELDPKTYGFDDASMKEKVFLNGTLGMQEATVAEVVSLLRETYSGTIGVEFMHIQFPEQKAWIQERIEAARGKPTLTKDEKLHILNSLVEVDSFEEFLQLRYPGVKRFSVQGGDTMLPGLEAMILSSGKLGVKEIVLGMPHRGRMNVLTTIMGKPYMEMFSLFHGNLDFPEGIESSGDVKYHLGASHDRVMPDGSKMHLSLTANPSHLEIVNPVVCGKVRAKQDQYGDTDKSQVLGIQLHGDAAFAGQGSVPETLALSELRGYRTGGSLHLIVNNQIGFTTAPKYSRFTPYPSDVAKSVQAPIFHVNGEDAEAVVFVCRLATEFRQQFKRDVVVDIFCYRKYGHNESDEPAFTQPVMYKTIATKPSPARIYADRLVREGHLSEAELEAKQKSYRAFFDEQYELAKSFTPNNVNWLEGAWAGMSKAEKGERADPDTGIAVELLKQYGKAMVQVPAEFHANKKLQRILQTREQAIADGKQLDWAAGEALAYASLLKEGHPVRLSGQDCGRGTFSHRHSVIVDQENEDRYVPLNHLGGEQSAFEVIDSSLSEMAVMGFEYGYSLAEPRALTIWEAQFGDFANGAQVVIDQFLASGEIKWLRMCGLVLLLPHGYEGQGPEHSSARPERFLQLCGEDNMQVVNCTTPANFFHVLRRQLHRNFRKPLVVMTPKSLLRHKMAVSALSEFAPGTKFRKLYSETGALVADAKVRRLVLCSGKVYYDLVQARDEQAIKDVAIVRVEQLYPLPRTELLAELKRYKNAELMWCQEEPQNMGYFTFIAPLLQELLDEHGRVTERVRYAGRSTAASPAAGYLKVHEREQKALVAQALATAADAKRKRA
ncbi:MAG: 2-oxoglutarate dehydrogenase E1 component [Rickettsiales bacterium]|nr:2-oxoglutarate dehydrogenase E1 component [Rickettsiales bacterium]